MNEDCPPIPQRAGYISTRFVSAAATTDLLKARPPRTRAQQKRPPASLPKARPASRVPRHMRATKDRVGGSVGLPCFTPRPRSRRLWKMTTDGPSHLRGSALTATRPAVSSKSQYLSSPLLPSYRSLRLRTKEGSLRVLRFPLDALFWFRFVLRAWGSS